jgi:ubiquinone/menaquinone biosynthesis C-methylase UbiE
VSVLRLSFPEKYEQWLVGPLFRPWVDETFDRMALAPADRVLDVACGTGVVARMARERLGPGATIVGIDINAYMLAVARSVAPDIDWREADAAALQLRPGEQFDVVVCQQGLQFMSDRQRAANAMAGALSARGRLAVLTWRPLEETPFFRDLHAIAERHLGPVVDQRHGFGDLDMLGEVLCGAGLRDVTTTTITRRIRFDDSAGFLRLNATALLGMTAVAKRLDERSRDALVARIVEASGGVAARFTDDGALVFDLSSNLAIGWA